MIWLILSIVASTGLFVVFELIQKLDIYLFPAIVVNYLVCSICGNLLLGESQIFQSSTVQHPGFYYMLFMGGMFIGAFFLMGSATSKAGSAKASVASKMSVIVPVLAAMFLLGQQSTLLQISGIAVGLVCVYFITKRDSKAAENSGSHALLLVLVFIGSGLVDTGLNFLSHFFEKSHANSAVFISTFIFSAAFVLGLLVYVFKVRKNQNLRAKELWAGLILGLVNFFSLYCVFKALDYYSNHTAYYWMLNNIGVVLFSTAVSVFMFKRQLDKANYIGLGLAVLAIVLLNL